MTKPTILCLDDQRDVLATLSRDLKPFAGKFDIVECESAAEAKDVLEDLDAEGEPVALIISDHVMPGETGIDFLIELNHDERFRYVRKLLLTGLATHEDTIVAINQADIDHYIQKPWTSETLEQAVRRELTQWVLATGTEYEDYLDLLDTRLLFELLKDRV